MLRIRKKSRGGVGNVPGFAYDGSKKIAVFEVTVPGTGSKQRRRKIVHDVTRDEALTAWRKFREEALNPKPEELAPKEYTLRQYVAENWAKIVSRVTPHTASGYATHLNVAILPELGDLPLHRINAAEVRDFAGRMIAGAVKTRDGTAREKGYSPQTVNHCLAILRRILRDAVDREVLTVYPIRGRLPMLKPTPLRLEMTPEERTAFLGAFTDEAGFRALILKRHEKKHAPPIEAAELAYYLQRFRASRPFFIVALETGLRLGDLLALQWSSVDLPGGWVRVIMSKTKEQAVIPISAELKSTLNELRFRKDDSGFVFSMPEPADGEGTGPTFKRWPLISLRRYFHLAKELAGIKRRLRFHDLRHTFASRLASVGASAEQIAKMLGHTSAVMTRRYARPDEASLRSAVDAVAKSERLSPENTSTNTAATK